MPFAENLSTFFADFGTQALFDGASAPVLAIFDGAADTSVLGGMGMATTSPALTLPTSDVPDPVEGLGVAVEGGQYRVAEHRPDGTGMSTLFLTRVA
jgi:hypothetical protein